MLCNSFNLIILDSNGMNADDLKDILCYKNDFNLGGVMRNFIIPAFLCDKSMVEKIILFEENYYYLMMNQEVPYIKIMDHYDPKELEGSIANEMLDYVNTEIDLSTTILNAFRHNNTDDIIREIEKLDDKIVGKDLKVEWVDNVLNMNNEQDIVNFYASLSSKFMDHCTIFSENWYHVSSLVEYCLVEDTFNAFDLLTELGCKVKILDDHKYYFLSHTRGYLLYYMKALGFLIEKNDISFDDKMKYIELRNYYSFILEQIKDWQVMEYEDLEDIVIENGLKLQDPDISLL